MCRLKEVRQKRIFLRFSDYLHSLSKVLSDVHAARYVHGIGVHWYLDRIAPPDITLGTTHHLYPEYFLFATEACSGWNPADRGVRLGSWDRAEDYAHDIIQVLDDVIYFGGIPCE